MDHELNDHNTGFFLTIETDLFLKDFTLEKL